MEETKPLKARNVSGEVTARFRLGILHNSQTELLSARS